MCSKCTRRNCKHYQQYLTESAETDEDSSDSDTDDGESDSGGESDTDRESEDISETCGNGDSYVPDHYDVSQSLFFIFWFY